MKRKVNKVDAIKFLKDRGIDETTNNIRTIHSTALLMEEYAIFKLKEDERISQIEIKVLEGHLERTIEELNSRLKLAEIAKEEMETKIQTLRDQKHHINKEKYELMKRLNKYEPYLTPNAKGA